MILPIVLPPRAVQWLPQDYARADRAPNILGAMASIGLSERHQLYTRYHPIPRACLFSISRHDPLSSLQLVTGKTLWERRETRQ